MAIIGATVTTDISDQCHENQGGLQCHWTVTWSGRRVT